jgi:hypothetical protein
MEMRVMSTARIGRDAPVRVDSGGAARAPKSGVGARSRVDRRVPTVMGDARKHWLGGVVFREQKFWQE